MTSYPQLVTLRDRAANVHAEAEKLAPELAEAQADLARLLNDAQPDPRAIDLQRQLVDELTNQLKIAREAAITGRRRYEEALDALPSSLDQALPCLLLPVRLETRIRLRSDGAAGDELVVRIFPDDVHIDDHDPLLSAAEVDLGRHYWQQRWSVEAGPAAAPDLGRQLFAIWQQLTGRLGPTRAAWVARVLTPTNLPPTGGAEPDFPDPPTRQPGTSRMTLAAALPDRWVVRAWRAGARLGEARGGLIPRPLAAGPPTVERGGPAHWLVDLDAAIAAGMAVVVRPSVPASIDRVDAVIAFGVRGSDTPAESAALLRDLLDAHQFAARTDGAGLDLVPQGTPTNNTPAARAPSRGWLGGGGSDAARPDRPATAARGDLSDADVLVTALGLPDRDPLGPADQDLFVLGRVEHAGRTDQRDAGAMATVLWPATWGYFLRQFVSGIDGITPDADLGDWRRAVIDTVRGRGPLPALRIGDQPYGVLPVLPADRWRPWPVPPGPAPAPGAVDVTSATGLVNLTRRARADWRAGIDAVPRVGRATDPTDDLLDLFATDAVSVRVRARGLLGAHLLANMWLAAGRSLDLTVYGQDLWQASRTLLYDWGLLDPAAPDAGDAAGKPRLGRAAFEPVAVESDGRLAGDGSSALDSAASLRFAAEAGPNELHDWSLAPDAPLLDRLVRHATLQAWADAAMALRPPDVRVDQPPWVEPELVDLADLRDPDPVAVPETPTAWRHLDRATMPAGDSRWPGEPPAKRVISELLRLAEMAGDPLTAYGPAGRRIVELAELRAALRWLAGRPEAVLTRTLGETLDVASHRMDAWLTAIATERLRVLRQAAPEGLYLGGFGVVTDLRARGTTPLSEGYLHAPSVGQATTAAVLRSGYLAHASGQLGERLALDLTSRRVRLALELAAGVRGGQPLGALLGYRFERALHQRPGFGLAQYLPALRQLAPLSAGKRTPVPEGTAVNAVATASVVDGLALLRADRARTIPWGQRPDGADVTLPGAGTADQIRLLDLIAELGDAVDALGDLGVAEAVHQAVHGNATAAGGSLDILAGGEVPPAVPEVVRTPHAGTGVTHRVLVALPDPADAAVAAAVLAWARGAAQPRAVAAPRLNTWAAMLLGDPARVRWRATWHGSDGVSLPGDPEATFTLAEVGLCPLDIVYFAGTPVTSETQTSNLDARGDLERLLALHAAANPPTGTAGGVVLLELAAATSWPAGSLTVSELLEVARAAHELLASARPAAAGDVAGPVGARLPAAQDQGGLGAAVTGAVAALASAAAALRAPFELGDPAAARAALAAAYSDLPAATFDTMTNLLDLPVHLDAAPAVAATGVPAPAAAVNIRNGLRRLAAFGLDGAAPLTSAGSAAAELKALTVQSRRVDAQAAARIAAAPLATSPAGALAAIFGPNFVAVPDLTVPDADALATALTARDLAGDASDLAVADWLDGTAHVRAGTARLADLRLLSEAAGSTATALRVAQLPISSGDWWAALPPPPQRRPGRRQPGGVVSLVFAGPPFAPADPFAGLLVDEWVEVLPATTQDTAVVFHVDAPGARAPQALLLACAADPSRPWDDDELENVVLDTLELAKIRPVDGGLGPGPGGVPPSAPPAGHFLPALLLARNTGGDPNGDTIATTFPLPSPP